MDYESLKPMLADKGILQIIWLITLTFFMAIVRVFYKEVKTFYEIVRSGILSIGAWMVIGVICYHLELPFMLTLFATSLMSFTWEKFFDAIMKLSNDFPEIFKEILKSYLKKWKK